MATPDSPPSVERLHVSRAAGYALRGTDERVAEREVPEACQATPESLPSVEYLHVSRAAGHALRSIDERVAEREVPEACHGHV